LISSDFTIVTDAGGEERAAAAAVIRTALSREKYLAYLGEVDSFQAELAAGVLALSLIETRVQAATTITWWCDNETLIKGLNGRTLPDSHLVAVIYALAERCSLRLETIDQDTPEAIRKDHLACHKACRWLQQEPGLPVSGLPLAVGRLAASKPSEAWQLVSFFGEVSRLLA